MGHFCKLNYGQRRSTADTQRTTASGACYSDGAESCEESRYFEEIIDKIGPQMANRPGGYLRIIKAGHRRGDAAPMAIVELVGMTVR